MPTLDDLSRVRLLISDTDTTAQLFADDQLQAFLDLNDGSVRLAAADALETLAARLQSVQSDDIQIDGSKRAAVLMGQAARLREQHYTHGEDSAFVIVRGPRF